MSILEQARRLHDRIYLSFDFSANPARVLRLGRFDKVQYGCGGHFIENWLNVDIRPAIRLPKRLRRLYVKTSLTRRHPFADGSFRFGFSEDFIEHISQADSLTFLSEVYRTFAAGGVLRLSTPSLEGVLRRHYRSPDFDGAKVGEHEAYALWGHVHFYSKESLELAAKHIGFRKVEFKTYGESGYPALQKRETRDDQQDLNLIAELTK